MLEFTESDALDRIDEIGQAFANDLNDGDGPDYEGLHTSIDKDGNIMLTYVGTFIDEDQEHDVKFYWEMKRKVFPGED